MLPIILPLGSGKCSSFGGPLDRGIGDTEGLSCIDNSDLDVWWFRRIFVSPGSWVNSKGLARNLDPNAFYCAMRWSYGSFGGVQGEILPGYTCDQIRGAVIAISANGNTVFAQPADWGPNTDTGRLIDLSPGILVKLGVETDSIVNVSAIV